MRISFTSESGITNPAPSCSTTAPTGFKTGSTVTCANDPTAAGFDIVVSTLADHTVGGTIKMYSFTVAGMVNAPSAKYVNDIRCRLCVDSACNNVLDTSNAGAFQFTAAPAVGGTLSVSSSSKINGVTDATLTFELRLT
jgi:hypothetical protein